VRSAAKVGEVVTTSSPARTPIVDTVLPSGRPKRPNRVGQGTDGCRPAVSPPLLGGRPMPAVRGPSWPAARSPSWRGGCWCAARRGQPSPAPTWWLDTVGPASARSCSTPRAARLPDRGHARPPVRRGDHGHRDQWSWAA
jgi:hypothetical protein